VSLADDVAEPYAATAALAIQQIHSLEPGAFHRWLYGTMRGLAAARGRPGGSPTVADWVGLCSLLAAVGRTDVPFDEAVDWLRHRAELRVAMAPTETRRSDRLVEVERLAAQGFDSARIAGVLGVTQRSVDRYLSELRKGEAA
jgi:hypothetical protein